MSVRVLRVAPFLVVACAPRPVVAPDAPAISPGAAPPVAAASPAWKDRSFILDDVEGLGLIGEERQAAISQVRAWAVQRGVRLVPAERVKAIEERAAAGLHVETGAQCGRPLSR